MVKHRFTAIALLLAAVSGASAQESQNTKASSEAAQGSQGEHGIGLELRPFAGRYIPFGSMGADFKGANSFGVQTALELSPYFHVVANVGWTDGTSTIAALSNGKTTIMQYDGGVEVNGVVPFGTGWSFRPFAGAGAGARSYSYEEQGVGSRTGFSGYGTVGAELRRAAIALRLEGRGYLNAFKQPLIEQTNIRPDAALALGLAYHLF